ncbi:MAG: LD-carboxypeptidase, partial [Caulobacteraceae bacterium]
IMRIGIVAPSSRFERRVADKVVALAARLEPAVELVIHEQCFLQSGHFAGPDAARSAAFVEYANDPSLDAVWFARGGYGSCRILESALPQLNEAARAKTYLGYSDSGNLLAGLYGIGFPKVAHGPIPQDIERDGGEAAVARALAWLARRDPASVEPSVQTAGAPVAAFNLTILSHLIGTPWQPDLAGHVLMLEEVSEHMYRIDRAMFHVTSNPNIRKVAGLRLGRCGDIPENDPAFEHTEEFIAQYWCERSGIPYLGRADIGHDAVNKVVPFGR